ncbi:MAG: hypothetical protein CMH30_04955 [Micavibrio sp.]|nr:hypothetical protein [Micavibrio sp.]|tara:strand:- start:4726 stop:4950 length:225 start_codon:yes stop_codon:yes gene_type:complete
MTPEETRKVETYLKNKFRNESINLKKRANNDDSVEVLMGAEFIGLLYKTEDEGETSFDFNMSILDIDLEGGSIA